MQRLSAIEEMAGMQILCSDKTGTLTKNELELDPNEVVPLQGTTLCDGSTLCGADTISLLVR